MRFFLQLSPARPILLFLAALLAARPAEATPPNMAAGAYMPLCTKGDRIAFFALANTNQGSHYVDSARFALLLFDSVTGKYEISRLGGLDLVGEDKVRGDRRDLIPGPKVSLAQQLSAWGTDDCVWVTQAFHRDWREKDFSFRLDSGLHVSYAGREQVIQEGSIFDPGNEIAEMTMEGFDKPSPLVEEGWEPPPSILDASPREDLRQLVMAQVELESRTVFVFRLVNEDSSDRDTIVSVPIAKLQRAKSWLVNAHALEDLHRKGQFSEAERLFEIASYLDPENPTPRYNRACASARQNEIHSALAQLMTLPPTAALRIKIERDPDFETIRNDEAFAAFVASLPKD